jgi:hypothetical protein
MQDELENISQVLENMRVAHIPERGTNSFPTTTEAYARTAPSEQDTIQTIVQASPKFQVTSNMLQMDLA